MVVGAKVCDLTEDLLLFVCGLYVGILTSPFITFLQVEIGLTPAHLCLFLEHAGPQNPASDLGSPYRVFLYNAT